MAVQPHIRGFINLDVMVGGDVRYVGRFIGIEGDRLYDEQQLADYHQREAGRLLRESDAEKS